ncbi:hypothetical protein EYF80_022049 [Liparis tanakae]|uniref:Uncharacterized protein n=1 Tax=Liparis tanakae TaxID=230148 RepID=A0A4Z2HRX6_9TELE|nr:hypothetical protein EYF80_022049 [Liparis tanakae]
MLLVGRVLHEHAALGPVLSDGGRVLVNLSPGRLLGDPLESSPRAGTFELGPMDTGHGRQGGASTSVCLWSDVVAAIATPQRRHSGATDKEKQHIFTFEKNNFLPSVL